MKNSKLKILFVSPESYYPENLNGVNKINFNLVKANDYYTVDYLTNSYEQERPSETCVQNHFTTNKTISKRSKLRSLFSLTPFNVFPKKDIIHMANFVNDKSKDYDIIHISSVSLLLAIHLINETEKVFFSSIDSLSLIMLRKYKSQGNIILKALYFIEYLKCRRAEKAAYNKVKSCHFVSDIDAQFAQRELHLDSPIIIPNGIDTNLFKDHKKDRDKKKLLFVGNFNYAPNQEAANFLIDHLSPRLLRRDKDIKIFLVGANPTEKMKTSKAENIVVTGKVESLEEYLQTSKYFISPIFSGAGIKNKVLEAMACGLITICTKLSLDGIKYPINYHSIDNNESPETWEKTIIEEIFNEDVPLEDTSDFHIEYSWSNIRKIYFKKYKEKVRS